MTTKDSLYMEGKNFPLCPLCEYGLYDAIGEKGFNCNNKDSFHFTRAWDLPIDSITSCSFFIFAVPAAKKWVESQIKKLDEKSQTTLGDYLE